MGAIIAFGFGLVAFAIAAASNKKAKSSPAPRDSYPAQPPAQQAPAARAPQVPAATAAEAAQTQKGKDAFDDAQKMYDAGNFMGAAVAFNVSYLLTRRPALLFNAATAWRRAGDTGLAVATYLKYLSLDLPADQAGNAATARLWINQLRQIAAVTDAAAEGQHTEQVEAEQHGPPDPPPASLDNAQGSASATNEPQKVFVQPLGGVDNDDGGGYSDRGEG